MGNDFSRKYLVPFGTVELGFIRYAEFILVELGLVFRFLPLRISSSWHSLKDSSYSNAYVIIKVVATFFI